MSNNGSLPPINYTSPSQRVDGAGLASVGARSRRQGSSADADRFDQILRNARQSAPADRFSAPARTGPSEPSPRERPDVERGGRGADGPERTTDRRTMTKQSTDSGEPDRAGGSAGAERGQRTERAERHPDPDQTSHEEATAAVNRSANESPEQHLTGRETAGTASGATDGSSEESGSGLPEGGLPAATPDEAAAATAGPAEAITDGSVGSVDAESASAMSRAATGGTEPSGQPQSVAGPANGGQAADDAISASTAETTNSSTESRSTTDGGRAEVESDPAATSGAAGQVAGAGQPVAEPPAEDAGVEDDVESDAVAGVPSTTSPASVQSEVETTDEDDPDADRNPTASVSEATGRSGPESMTGALATVARPTSATDQAPEPGAADGEDQVAAVSTGVRSAIGGAAAGGTSSGSGSASDAGSMASDQTDGAPEAVAAGTGAEAASVDVADSTAPSIGGEQNGQATTVPGIGSSPATAIGQIGQAQTIGQLSATEVAAAGIDASALAPTDDADGTDPLWLQVRRAMGSLRTTTTGEQQLTIRLRPAELGSVVVRVNTGENGTVVSLVTESSAAANQLNQQRQQLLNELEDSGLGRVNVDIDSNGDDRSQTEESDNESGDGGRRGRVSRTSNDGVDSNLVRGYGSRRDRGPSSGLVDVDL